MTSSVGGGPLWHAQDGRGLTCDPVDASAQEFHRGLPGYAPTPLVEAPALAAELGVGRLFVKDESARFDLGAFKYLGASWATFRALAERSGYDGPYSLDGLRQHLTAGEPTTLLTATDGNHGRAVARMARLLDLPARVYVPDVVPQSVIDRIEAEAATVHVVAGDYDSAIAAAREDESANADGVLVQDTAWEGYTRIPGWIVEGYDTLFAEIDTQLAAAGVGHPALVAVPIGVGSLAQAAVVHYRAGDRAAQVALLGVEPDTAACVLQSLASEQLTSVATADTVMNGLNCGTPSELAWPLLRAGLDAAVAVTDQQDRESMAALATAGIASGPSGAASFAGVRAALTGTEADVRRKHLGITDHSVVVCISTEGPLPLNGER